MEQRFTSIRPAEDLPRLQAILAARQLPEGQQGRGWYSIKNLSQAEAEVYIYDYIGIDGVSASEFIRDLSDIKASTITLRINSGGGDVFDGVAIFNALNRHRATVNAYIDGVAASAAAFIAMAGDTITMSPHAQMMVHEASGIVMGFAADMRQMADFLDKANANIASIFAGRAAGTTEDWLGLMNAETWFSDQEAVDAGLADGIDGVEAAAKVELTIVNESEEEPEEAETEDEQIDWKQVLEDIADEAEDAQFAVPELGG